MSLSSRRSGLARNAPPSSYLPRGFTLAELIVALVLLTVGLLALASTSAFLTWQHAASGRAERAAIAGGSRLEALRNAPCIDAHGSETTDELTVTWAIATSGRIAHANVRVSWTERGAPVVQRYESGFTC